MRFEEGNCPYTFPEGVVIGENVRCGYVTVPERHDDPAGATIRLAGVVYSSQSDTPAPDPIIIFGGGPGDKAQRLIGALRGPALEAFTMTRDVILFDQRGVGASEPALDCPEIGEGDAVDAEQRLSPQEVADRYVAAALACAERLEGQGINLSAFNSAESASDVNAIRAALDYDQINLIGTSYGTRLALTVMRDHPDVVRSAFLDSPAPPQVDLVGGTLTNLDRSLTRVFDACAADAACSQAYPTLDQTFSDLYATLNTTPISVTVTNPLTDQPLDAVIDGDRFVGVVFGMLYSPQRIALLPQLVYGVQQGDTSLLAELLPDALIDDGGIARGMHYSVQCSEEIGFSNAQTLASSTGEVLPELAAFEPALAKEYAICAEWPVEQAAAIENEPVTSDIPTLIFVGGLDPVTPPANAEQAVASLNAATVVAFPGAAHAVTNDAGGCGFGILMAFLDDPTAQVDANCAAEIQLAFETP
jgi:pimeloyl-ACP methyl ester carboxylesterase